MDEERARQLGSEVAGWYLHADLGEQAALLIDTAVSMLTREFIPDEVVVAVSEGEPRMPLVTATDSEALYLVDVPELPGEADRYATARCRFRPFSGEDSRAQVEASYRGLSFTTVRGTRHASWRFQVDDISLAIETRVDLVLGRSDEREQFARTLATSLGRALPAPLNAAPVSTAA